MRLFGKLLGCWRGALAATLAEEHIAALRRLAGALPAHPGAVGWPDARQSSTRYLQSTLSEAGIRPLHAQDGQTFDLG